LIVTGDVGLAMTKDENLHCFPIDRSGPWLLDERVCYYDINAASSFANLQPVRQYAEHEVLLAVSLSTLQVLMCMVGCLL
jgi:hypothetical protein